MLSAEPDSDSSMIPWLLARPMHTERSVSRKTRQQQRKAQVDKCEEQCALNVVWVFKLSHTLHHNPKHRLLKRHKAGGGNTGTTVADGLVGDTELSVIAQERS